MSADKILFRRAKPIRHVANEAGEKCGGTLEKSYSGQGWRCMKCMTVWSHSYMEQEADEVTDSWAAAGDISPAGKKWLLEIMKDAKR